MGLLSFLAVPGDLSAFGAQHVSFYPFVVVFLLSGPSSRTTTTIVLELPRQGSCILAESFCLEEIPLCRLL